MGGDEATEPSLQVAAASGKPCLCVPCNECIRFYPHEKMTYDGYVEKCIAVGNQQGGRFEFAYLSDTPFSRCMVVQPPFPDWASAALKSDDSACNSQDGTATSAATLTVPISVLKDMGVLHQALWKMEL